MGPLYAAVRAIAWFWIWFFFERIEVRHPERVPPTGPVLLCINHPNNLIDSLLVGSVLSRKVHFLATAFLFRNPLIARFLVALGVVHLFMGWVRKRGFVPFAVYRILFGLYVLWAFRGH